MKLTIKDLAFSYQNKPILNHLSFDVREGEFISLVGPSGCGKSTILNLLAGIIIPDYGTILADGERIHGLSSHFAYMPQNDLLFSWKTILENVCLYGKIHGTEKALREKALKSFPLFGLEGYENSYPSELSGGMKQRAAFLRTALCHADILLLDEPFGALDVITRSDMQDWLISMRNQLNRTTILVTHDIDEAIYLSDRIFILGGTPASILKVIELKEKNRTHEWLYNQGELKTFIYKYIKNQSAS